MKKQPEEYLGYWFFYTQRNLFYAFSEVLRAWCAEHDKPYVVTPPQWGVLSLLIEDDGMTIGSISQRRGIDAPTATGIVKRLAQNDLIERVHDREDRRVVKVFLTDEGRDIMRYLPDVVDRYNQITVKGFTEAEQQDLIAKFHKIIANLSELGPGLGDRFGLVLDFLQDHRQDN